MSRKNKPAEQDVETVEQDQDVANSATTDGVGNSDTDTEANGSDWHDGRDNLPPVPEQEYCENSADEQLQDPNIIYVGRDGRAPASIRDGRNTFTLPDAETQAAGFYHAHAGVICRLLPSLYKAFIRKGE